MRATIIGEEARRKLRLTEQMIDIHWLSLECARDLRDFGALAVEVADQTFTTPDHRRSGLKVRDRQHEWIPDDMRKLVIFPIQLVAKSLRKTKCSRTKEESLTLHGHLSWRRIVMVIGDGRICGDCFDPSDLAAFIF